MSSKLSVFLTIISMLLFQGIAFSSASPSETAIFKLPKDDLANWKEISRLVNEVEGLVEYIPKDQKVRNWTELISIQYMKLPSLDTKAPDAIGTIVDKLSKYTLSKYPKVSWNIIEKNKSDVIYEWILHESFRDIPIQQEVARAFLTDSGFHRVGITRKNAVMTEDERTKWVKLLKEFSSVMPFGEAYQNQAFSLVKKTLDNN